MHSTPTPSALCTPSRADSDGHESRRPNIHVDWFNMLEEMGEAFLFRMGRYLHGMSEPEWFFLPHQYFDGLGGFAHLLRTNQQTELVLPEIAPNERPSGFLRWLSALRLLFRRPPRPRAWQTDRPHPLGRPGLAWTLFTTTETLAVRTAARLHGVSLNAWLLWGLAESGRSRLAKGREPAVWIVPINLRGAVRSERDTANLASILDVTFPLPATPSAVDAALHAERRRLGHFGAWQLLHLAAHLPLRLRRAIIRHEASVPKHGSFSNLGCLAPREPVTLPTAEWWMAFNPVMRTRPVGMACLTWCGRMAVTLQLHSVLSCSDRDTRSWLSDWRELVLPSSQRSQAAPAEGRLAATAKSPGGSRGGEP